MRVKGVREISLCQDLVLLAVKFERHIRELKGGRSLAVALKPVRSLNIGGDIVLALIRTEYLL